MKNQPHLIILKQKNNANTKSPMILTQLVLHTKSNLTLTQMESQKNRKNAYGALIGNYEKLFVLVMYVLPQVLQSSSVLYLF